MEFHIAVLFKISSFPRIFYIAVHFQRPFLPRPWLTKFPHQWNLQHAFCVRCNLILHTLGSAQGSQKFIKVYQLQGMNSYNLLNYVHCVNPFSENTESDSSRHAMRSYWKVSAVFFSSVSEVACHYLLLWAKREWLAQNIQPAFMPKRRLEFIVSKFPAQLVQSLIGFKNTFNLWPSFFLFRLVPLPIHF